MVFFSMVLLGVITLALFTVDTLLTIFPHPLGIPYPGASDHDLGIEIFNHALHLAVFYGTAILIYYILPTLSFLLVGVITNGGKK